MKILVDLHVSPDLSTVTITLPRTALENLDIKPCEPERTVLSFPPEPNACAEEPHAPEPDAA